MSRSSDTRGSATSSGTELRPARATFRFDDFRRTRFVRGVRCPRCRSNEVCRWGGYSGRRRYRCKACRRTFSDFTGTPLAYLKKIDGWLEHCCSVEAVETVRHEAARLGIHRNTAFRWRHRLLGAMSSRDTTRLGGVVMLRETSFHYSQKGSRHVVAPRRRGWRAGWESFRLPSVCVMIARSRAGRVLSAIAGSHRPSEKDYQNLLGGRLDEGVRLASGRGPVGSAVAFAKRNGHAHDEAHSWQDERAEAGRYIARLRSWIRRFHGVATKYLPHYLLWHRYLMSFDNPGVELARWRLSTVMLA